MSSHLKHFCLWGFAMVATASLACGQIVQYQATYTSTSPGFVSGTASLTIDSSTVPTDGSPSTPNLSLSSSWLKFIEFRIDVGQTYQMFSTAGAPDNEITSVNWENSSSPTLNPTVFYFSGSSSDPVFTVTGSPSQTLTVSAGGSTYTLNQASFSAVPEPEEWAAIASSGLLAFAFWHRRSRKAAKA
ncbi:MAG: hypothetical protein FJ379_07950 [Verrucomicrobia bacterium]|nr:hypothetical protein [Verrucomicrobiota bacterium]